MDAARQSRVVSIGQFRPEKDHELQLRAFAAFLKSPYIQHMEQQSHNPSTRNRAAVATYARPVLYLIGGCRDANDEARVAALRALVIELGLQHDVVCQCVHVAESVDNHRLLLVTLIYFV